MVCFCELLFHAQGLGFRNRVDKATKKPFGEEEPAQSPLTEILESNNASLHPNIMVSIVTAIVSPSRKVSYQPHLGGDRNHRGAPASSLGPFPGSCWCWRHSDGMGCSLAPAVMLMLAGLLSKAWEWRGAAKPRQKPWALCFWGEGKLFSGDASIYLWL